jgi:hypothetical protein
LRIADCGLSRRPLQEALPRGGFSARSALTY